MLLFLKKLLLRCLIPSVLSVFSTYVAAQPVANFSGTPISGCVPLVVNFTDLSTGNPTAWKWDLGNGTISVLQNPAVTYFTAGQYNIKLVVRNLAGSDSIIRNQFITVNANPVVNFTGTPLTGCFPLLTQFTDLSVAGSGTIDSRQWDFGDGSISTLINPQHTYTSGGNYNVSLRVKNTSGCIQSLTKLSYISVNTGVHADFTQTVPNSCNPPVNVSFQNLSTGVGILNYQWSFGDGSFSVSTNPSHIYTTTGSYTVKLIVTNALGCSDTLIRNNAVVVGSVVANFTMPDTICVNAIVPISNTSSPMPTSVLWNFGDGSTSTSFNPVKIYQSTGNFTVKLVDNFGTCKDSISKVITVQPRPVLSFSGNPLAACKAPLAVHFVSSIAGATSFFWLFGDGATSTATNPIHTYTTPGIFDVTLIASNNLGCTDTLKRIGYIKIQPPQVQFNGLPVRGCIPLSYTFSPIITSVDSIVSYFWDFGDGATSTLPNPPHTWIIPGMFTVRLILTTAGGCVDTTTLVNAIQTGVKPVPDFTASPLEACANVPINFTDLSTGAPDHWVWKFGDGDSSHLPNPIHLYSDTGIFSVTLIVSNNGCTDSITFNHYIHIKPPIANFSIGFSCSSPFYREFIDHSIGADTWQWNFGDGGTASIPNPTHTFSGPGQYSVSLTVTNNVTGCSHTRTSIVTVINEAADFFSADTNICRGSSAVFHVRNMNVANISSFTWKFGDGTVSSDTIGTETHQYITSGRYTVTLITTTKLSCQDTIIKPFYIHVSAPTAAFTSTNLISCYNTPVLFSDSSRADSAHTLSQWIWNYGDGNIQTYTAPPFLHTYTLAGVYSILLKVADNQGCTDSARRINYITISRPVVSFSSPDTISCPNSPVHFSNVSSGTNNTYLWNFGDGSISTLLNPNHQYNAVGVYTVSLVATDQYGCKDSLVRLSYISIASPHAQFSMSDSTSTCPPLVVSFTNASTNYTSLLWNFGDGTTSNLLSPTHFYSSPGNYSVTLSVTSPGLCTDQMVKHVIVSGPVGSFNYNNTTGCAPVVTNFRAHTPNQLRFIWDFNDGTTINTSDSIISHEYITPGMYLPKLILIDPNGCQVPIVGTDTIRVDGVLAKYIITDGVLCDSGFVHFTNNSIVVGTIQSYFWTFGDGTNSPQPSPATHYYASSGLYNTSLIVTTQTGCADTAYNPIPIRIVSSPKSGIGGDSASCVPALLQFQGLMLVPDSSAISWKWTFGNGQTSTQQVPAAQHYTTPGNYTVQSIATNSTGCSDTVLRIVQVYPLPAIRASAGTRICRGQSSAISASGGSVYTWTPATGLSCTNCQNPVASPDSTRRYVVTGTSSFGCSSTDSLIIAVQQPFVMSVDPPDTICIGKNIKISADGADRYVWSPAQTLNDPNVKAPLASPDHTTTYTVIGSDNYGCFSNTGYVQVVVYPIPVVRAGQSRTINVGQSINLVPSISPDVTSAAWFPLTGISMYNFPGVTVRPNVTTEYNIRVTNQGHCIATDKLTIYVVCNDANVFIPNTFSPNGDGANDVFYIRGSGVFKIKTLRVFNRWGEVVFEGSNINPNDASTGWDGTYKGKKLTPDVFVYTAEVLCSNNSILTYKGNVTLIQ